MKIFLKILFTCLFFGFGVYCAEDDLAANEAPISRKPYYRVVGYKAGIVRAYDLTPEDKPFSVNELKTKDAIASGRVCCFYFNIVDRSGATVGALNTQWIPNPVAYFKEDYYGTTPMLRIVNISVGRGLGNGFVLGVLDKNDSQKNGYGTQALEALFVALRQSDFPQDARVCLECPTYVEHLPPWYKTFGFKEIETPISILAEQVQYMAAPIKKLKFPLHKKRKKAATKIQALWRGYAVRKSVREIVELYCVSENPNTNT